MYFKIAELLLYFGLSASILLLLTFPWLNNYCRFKTEKIIDKILLLQFSVIFFGFSALLNGYLSDDFRILNVFLNSHQNLPLLYKFTAMWGSHDGSMLLWLFVIAWLGFLSNQTITEVKHKKWINLTIIAITSFYLLYLLVYSNPFIVKPILDNSAKGFNPLLQDIALGIHPPILFIGYLTTMIPFAIATSILFEGKTSAMLLNKIYDWALISWTFLTMGIVLGSWWAYRELGWGGYWFWDPVENASLLPWFMMTALIHSAKLSLKNNYVIRTTLLLSLLGFLMVLIASFFVRSGAVISVHSFAQDFNRGKFILFITWFWSIFSVIIYLLRIKFFIPNILENNNSKNYFLNINGIFVANYIWIACAFIIICSLIAPLIGNLFNLSISLEEKFFKNSLLPLMLSVFLICGLSFSGNTEQKNPINKIVFFIIILILVAVINFFVKFKTNLLFFAFYVGNYLVINCFTYQWRIFKKKGSLLSNIIHGLFGLMIILLCISEQFNQEFAFKLESQKKINFIDFQISYQEKKDIQTDNYFASKIKINIYQKQKYLTSLNPEVRFYPVEKAQTSESAIYHNLFYDLYIVISEIKENQDIIVKLYYKPFITLIWVIFFLISIISFKLILQGRNKILIQ